MNKQMCKCIILLASIFTSYSSFSQLVSTTEPNKSAQVSNSNSQCALDRSIDDKIKIDMTMQEIKNQIGSQYAALIKQIGTTYEWSKNTDQSRQDWTTGEVWEITIGFYNNGSYLSSMIMGIAPKELTESINNGKLTLREVDRILGKSKLGGYIYRLVLPSSREITLETDTNNVAHGISAACPNN